MDVVSGDHVHDQAEARYHWKPTQLGHYRDSSRAGHAFGGQCFVTDKAACVVVEEILNDAFESTWLERNASPVRSEWAV